MPVVLAFAGDSAGEESACNAGDLGSIPGLERFPGEGKGYPPVFWPGEFHGQYSPWGHKESDTTERLSLSFSDYTCYPTTRVGDILKFFQVIFDMQYFHLHH